ncbi:glucose-1-phosphate thymidylyltransferase [Halohasta litchfieldiae]|jgi:Nucleoside-diphosphate-sugar pyrophosphorylase involved in lipopolysaccharide biosynthesis/translation initiation factor 2B, gamma/epsilon subunits (eIF-2Bgamma/eIF-2Bepsilon)|uniref:Bifunctional protein GlmU n=1 Tax=Halohasta litchfieldiae TaxID=1073996 RepID=A0A1H6XRP5_9EURY|nr:sugar phosphate nucleotidyltransferase [Halohasta litchfieldiae]ATW89136.1 glucose-1-phosphate thymidylyltransferase [Halohasta litchfieldiae]SEJ30846.1 glucose-1-phosphate thymidylyltransferase [Halohasta litchfieldiae]
MSNSPVSDDSRPSSAVVLAAGEGIRLRPLTANRPKPMLPAGTRPILEHVLNALIDAGVDDIHLVVGYQANRVRSYFDSTYRDVPITYHTQANQLGSGHALLQARDGPDGPFLLVNGDQIIDHRIVEAVSEAHGDGTATLAVVEGPEAVDYGAVHLDGSEVTELIEQPASGEFRLFNAGVYAFTEQIFETLETLSVERGELPLTDAIQQLIADDNHSVSGVRTDHFWMDATHPWDLLSLSRELLSRGWVDAPTVDTDIYVAESAHVHPDATLVGPVVVDSDAVIEAGAVVGPYAAIGASTTVGSGSVVSDVVVDTDTVIGSNTTAIELVAGQGCEIGAALTAAGGPADVVLDEQVYSNVDLGGVIADRVDIGGGATLEPGALIGPGSTIGAGVIIRGHINAGSEVVR